MFQLRNTLAAASLLIGATTSAAFAANWPTNLAGSGWQGTANGSALTLEVKTQGGGGACAAITGTMTAGGGTSTATGYYCPATGAVVVFRSNNNQPFQVFSGSISESPANDLLGYAMSGTFGQYYDGGITGFYPFSLIGSAQIASLRH